MYSCLTSQKSECKCHILLDCKCASVTTALALQGYEPYVLVTKNLVPWYDERFTGYLEDKILHIQNMVSMGFSFAVHPEAFVVHYPHPNSKDQQLVKSTNLFDEVCNSAVLSRLCLPCRCQHIYL